MKTDATDNHKRNTAAFLWHALWLAFTRALADYNTILPALVLTLGGAETVVGMLTSINIGIPLITQLLFSGYLVSRKFKKPYLLLGIYLRVCALAGLFSSVWLYRPGSETLTLVQIFGWMLLFNVSGAFAGVSYTDILGKSIRGKNRRSFLVWRQIITSSGILISAVFARSVLKSQPFPNNYQYLFALSAFLLFIASLGFLFIREKPAVFKKFENTAGLKTILQQIPVFLKEEKNVFWYILTTNLIGFTVILIPFFIAFFKHNFELSSGEIGDYVVFHMLGMIVSNLIWSQIIKRKSFKGLFYTAIFLEAFLAFLFGGVGAVVPRNLIKYFFLLTGSATSAYRISSEGALLEISTDENRALVSGIVGSLNVVSAIFPLLAGLLIPIAGYKIIFYMAGFFTLSAIGGLRKINCPADNTEKKI